MSCICPSSLDSDREIVMITSKSRNVSCIISLGVLLGALSLAVTMGTLAIPNIIHNNAELVNVDYGWPFRFIRQDQSRFPLGGDGPPLPYSSQLSSPWENPTQFLLLPFLADFLFWYAVAALGCWTLYQGLKLMWHMKG